MLITERYASDISVILSCYDRVIVQGSLLSWGFASGMSAFLNSQNIRIFDFPQFAEPLTESLKKHIQQFAKENHLEIEFIRKHGAFRKEDRIQGILKSRGTQQGVVHIFSAMESCHTYKPWHDKSTGTTSLKRTSGKCLHYYIYLIDKDYGLCYLRIQTWCPFRLQFYFNGHNLLAAKLDRQGIGYELHDNAFLSVEDWEKAQNLSDHIRANDFHQVLDILANRYCPFIKTYNLMYQWTIMQAEYATDIVFKNPSDLTVLYDNIIRTSIHAVKPDNIATFLGKKIQWNFEGEVGNNYNRRILGTRIKHHMGAISIKMYDKFGMVLRIESTVNDISEFRVPREVEHRDGTCSIERAPMKKTIYNLYPLAQLLKDVNQRYLDFISTFDDPSGGEKKLGELSYSVKENDRSYKGFNFFSQVDQLLFETLARGEFNIKGFQNKTLHQYIPEVSSSAITRILKRLQIHGLIEKAPKTRNYYLTQLGKSVIILGLKTRAFFIIPQLTTELA